MMLLIGMKISLTKNPTNPITTKPIAVRNATFVNSASTKSPLHRTQKIATKTPALTPDLQKIARPKPEKLRHGTKVRGGRRSRGVYLCGRACGIASRGGRCPWRTLSRDRWRNRWHPSPKSRARNPRNRRDDSQQEGRRKIGEWSRENDPCYVYIDLDSDFYFVLRDAISRRSYNRIRFPGHLIFTIIFKKLFFIFFIFLKINRA